MLFRVHVTAMEHYCAGKISMKKKKSSKSALKVIPPILLCWHMVSEVDVGGMATEVELSYQYFITFCCHVTDGSRGAG